MHSNLPDFLEVYRVRVDRCLESRLSRLTAPGHLLDAMRYSLFNGGKRVRPALVYSASGAMDGNPGAADRAACAVELVHAYSLVHDDLPSMDDDDLRRGKPTTHIAFGEATAILAGDAMQALAFELLGESTDFPAEQALAMVRILARACGAEGMVAGQVIDLQATGHAIEDALLETMHLQKTAALISASVQLGALTGIPSMEQLAGLRSFGDHLGLAFQIQDDILDIEGPADVTGKPQGSDLANEKTTYVSMRGADGARAALAESAAAAHRAIADMGTRADELHGLVEFVIHRSF